MGEGKLTRLAGCAALACAVFAGSPAAAQTAEGLPFESAARDRLFLGFTGYVLPKGEAEFTAYDLFIWEFGYGVGEGLEVGAELSPSLMSTTFFYSFSLRYQLVSRGSLGIATYTSYTGLATPDSSVAYANAIIQGLALTAGSRRLLFNLPIAGLATNVKGSDGCDDRLGATCDVKSTWRFAVGAMPGFSLLFAEPEPGEQVRGMIELIAGVMPGESGAWLVLGNIGIRWEDRGYLADVGVSVPIATGYGGKPFGDALRWGGWVVPLINFSVGW